MFNNPFTPLFGGKPELFFGRQRILAGFDSALVDAGGEYRALYITGNRGSGKTALLEHLSGRAREDGWHTIDVGPENTLELILRNLVREGERTSSLAPEVEVNVFGAGGKVQGPSVSKTVRYDVTDLEIVFLEKAQKAKKGILITIDEVQKLSLDDMSAVCNMFQMASRKGCDVMLALAGLPFSYAAVIKHEGCTFMRRGVHEELGLLSHQDVKEAFVQSFQRVKGVSLSREALDALVEKSCGHPYVMQLLGYYLVALLNDRGVAKRHVITAEEVAETFGHAINAYERRALQPIVEALTPAELRYLRAMVEVANEKGVIRSSDVASALGKTAQQLSVVRKNLMDTGTIISVGRGLLMFNVPYMRAFLAKPSSESENTALVREWGL